MYYIFWVCVCNLRYPACNVHALYCHLWPARLYSILPHYLTNGLIVEKATSSIKYAFWFSLHLFVWNISHSMEKWTAYKKYTGRVIMFSVITNIYNKKTKGPTWMELFTATGKLKKFFFWQLDVFDVCRVTRGAWCTHRTYLVIKKISFPVAVNNSIKVGPLVFLL